MINERPFAIVKGAPEIVLPKCNNCNSEEILKINDQMANDALRVVCIAMRPLESIPANPTSEETECNLTFVGLLGLVEPIRNSVIEEIKLCKKAGIKLAMLTGDNPLTAGAIAKKIGLITEDSQVIDGSTLVEMSDRELEDSILNYSVFARISPNDKLRLVKAFKNKKSLCGRQNWSTRRR